ncbi:MAG: DegT/DnrJ/EryC1/StrS family aminotransferase [Chloroflexota bacterium]
MERVAVSRFPFIRPDVPPIASWAPILEEAYRAGRYTNFGPLSRRLEAHVATTWGDAEAVCVAASSGTAAIAAPLIASGVTGRVILPAFTFAATLAAVRMAGAEPFLVDVDPTDWRIAPETLAEALRVTGTRSAVVLCPFGIRSDFRAHAAIVGARGGVLVVDDAAGIGADRRPVPIAPHTFEACSLHATKPFAVGEGGVILAHRSREAALRRALNFGLDPASPADLDGWGINGKLSELHAAVGLAAAVGFDDRLARRRGLARRYIHAVAPLPGIVIETDPHAAGWQFFPMLLPHAEAATRFIAAAAARGMETRRYYAPALSAGTDVDRLGSCPVAEDLAARMCCVPVYATLTDAEADAMVAIVADSLAEALGHARGRAPGSAAGSPGR